MRRRVTVLGLCVCVSVCLSVCLCVRHHESCHYAQLSVQPKVSTASSQSGKHFKYGVFSKNALFKKLWREKANKLISSYVLTATSYGADGATFRQKFGPFLVLSKSNGRLQATCVVRQRATSLSAVQFVQGFCFCSLPYTFRYMVNACAFSQPHARATAL